MERCVACGCKITWTTRRWSIINRQRCSQDNVIVLGYSLSILSWGWSLPGATSAGGSTRNSHLSRPNSRADQIVIWPQSAYAVSAASCHSVNNYRLTSFASFADKIAALMPRDSCPTNYSFWCPEKVADEVGVSNGASYRAAYKVHVLWTLYIIMQGSIDRDRIGIAANWFVKGRQ